MATKRAWKKHNITNPLFITRNGEDCLDFLYRRGEYENATGNPQIDLLLLDLNMPKLGGIDVLRALREDDRWRDLKVVVLTTSKAEEDRIQSYDLGIHAYIAKPIGFENFASAMHAINLFWNLVEPRLDKE